MTICSFAAATNTTIESIAETAYQANSPILWPYTETVSVCNSNALGKSNIVEAAESLKCFQSFVMSFLLAYDEHWNHVLQKLCILKEPSDPELRFSAPAQIQGLFAIEMLWKLSRYTLW